MWGGGWGYESPRTQSREARSRLTKQPFDPRPLHPSLALVTKHDYVSCRLAVSESVPEWRQLVCRVRSIGGLDASQSRFGRHLDGDPVIRPILFGLVKDALVEDKRVSKVGIGSATQSNVTRQVSVENEFGNVAGRDRT